MPFSVSAGSSGWEPICCRYPWARLTYNAKFEAYELDIAEDELRRAQVKEETSVHGKNKGKGEH